VERDWLATRLAAGNSYEAIARELDRHPSTVSYWARRHGLVSEHVARHAGRGGIDRDVLVKLVSAGLSTREMAARVDRSQATVRHWLREYDLRTRGARAVTRADAAATAVRECAHHGQTRFVPRSDGRGWRCLRCRAEAVVRRRQKVKATLVREAGGACAICGYARHVGALGFHHVEPTTKRFALSHMGVSRSIDRARAEAAKCVLLCANCHAEVEAGVTQVGFR
jgi:transposase